MLGFPAAVAHISLPCVRSVLLQRHKAFSGAVLKSDWDLHHHGV